MIFRDAYIYNYGREAGMVVDVFNHSTSQGRGRQIPEFEITGF